MTALFVPQSKVIFFAFSNGFLIFSMDLPATKNPRSSINDRQVISGTRLSISKNTPLMYIRKRMGDTGDLCGILVSTLHLGLMNLSITSSTLLLVRKDCVHPIRSSLIPRSAIL